MTDTTSLNARIEESGLKRSYIYGKLGLSKTSFWNRMNGRVPFKAEEIAILSKLLGLTSRETMHIFFSNV